MDTYSRGTGPIGSRSQPITSPRPGDIVLGSFRLQQQIGVGSFATAHLAEQLGTDRLAVVKIPHPHLLHGPHGAELRRRFDSEAKAATRAKHPNLVTVYVVGDTQYGVPAIAMEHVAGESLHDRLTRAAPMPVDQLHSLGDQLADALATLHSVGIVHRDLSPANVLVTQIADVDAPQSSNSSIMMSIMVKLLDFGVAKLLDAPSRTLGPMGTPGYLAPEQLLGGVTPRSDVYSLGAVLWWGITGHERTDDFSDGSLRASLGRRVGPDPRTLNPAAPVGMAQQIARALIPEPQLRPTMSEFLREWRACRPHGHTRGLRSTMMTPRPFAPASERITTARTQASINVAIVVSDPSMGAQVASHLVAFADLESVVVTQTNPRELGRASPGAYDLAVLDEQLPGIDTASLLAHLHSCYPELLVIVVGFAEHRRTQWQAAGAQAFVRLPDQLDQLRAWVPRRATTLSGPGTDRPSSTVDTQTRLDRAEIERRLSLNPGQLAASLDSLIGLVPELIAQIDRLLGLPRGGEHGTTEVLDALDRLVSGSESVGASNLARLARAVAESLATNDVRSARVFLAAAEREYLDVFREAFALLNQITRDEPLS